jgi:septum formation protein
MSGRLVSDLAEANALAKVHGARLPEGVGKGAFVLGTDTLVSVGRTVMGKPASAEEATEMLCALSGRRHRVVSGMALARLGGESMDEATAAVRVANASTQVAFARLDKEQIAAYVDSGEWRGKAGGYAVQGLAALFVRGIRGEYSNVVGLPLHLMYGLFSELGFDLVRRDWVARPRSRPIGTAESQ